ncbi:uncharacterized protein LOC142776412 [Rhipicephalus microplus]|uniref:uncharacterized protein LOC142776412 n=1 Tax=Rhipicephalus microplus TaxID=6941 RepID=UPI003F6B4FC4
MVQHRIRNSWRHQIMGPGMKPGHTKKKCLHLKGKELRNAVEIATGFEDLSVEVLDVIAGSKQKCPEELCSADHIVSQASKRGAYSASLGNSNEASPKSCATRM